MSRSVHTPVRFWQLQRRRLRFRSLPLVMGIINVTPDSFFDGGRFLEPAAAVEHALRLVAEGADLLDVGGESTRPGAEPVSADEELRRVMPVLEQLCPQVPVPVCIDTSKAAVAREALQSGVEVVNDVTALRGDPQMLPLVVESGCGVCLMHMQGSPQTMQEAPRYDNVVAEVSAFLAQRRDVLLGAGVDRPRIALDPGIGFGKTLEHNLALLRNVRCLHELGCTVLIGHSRKRFIGQVLGDAQLDRTAGTIGVCLALARQGVQVLRMHDVGAVVQALQLFEATGGLDPT